MENIDPIGHATLETMSFAKWYNEWILSLMEPYLGSDILEIGCGIGNFTQLLAKKGNVTASDINEGYIKGLKKVLGKTIDVGFGDVDKNLFFFTKRNFDSIVCLNVLEHVEKDIDALKNMYKLLNDSGKLILLVPAHESLFSKFDKEIGHYRRYNKKEIVRKLNKAGFKPIKTIYLNWWAAIGWLVFLKFFKKRIMPKTPVQIFDFFGKTFLLPERYFSPPFGLSVFTIAQKK